MNKEDIRKVFDRLEPDEDAVGRMLNNIVHSGASDIYKNTDNKKEGAFMKGRYLKRMIPAAAMVLLLAGASLTYHFMNTGNMSDDNSKSSKESDMGGSYVEDDIARLEDQFQIDDRHYILLSDEQKKEYGFPADIQDEDIGELILTITKSVDDKLIGKSVYEYLPAGCSAVVAVDTADGYKLFKFFTFESYIQNEDEDAIEYLRLYGINGASDIDRVEFIRISEERKLEGYSSATSIIKDAEGLEKFHGYFSVLKNSSKEYFDRLFNYSNIDRGETKEAAAPPETPPEGRDMPETNSTGGQDAKDEPAPDASMPQVVLDGPAPYESVSKNASDLPLEQNASSTVDSTAVDPAKQGSGDGVPSSVQGSAGSIGNALDDGVIIRIYNKHGLYLETYYYPNIGFISRYKVSPDFAEFLKAFI